MTNIKDGQGEDNAPCECGKLSFMLMGRARRKAMIAVSRERDAQLIKWGEQKEHGVYTFLSILGEEVGEAHKAALHTQFGGPEAGGLRDELIQVAAVAVQMIELLDSKEMNEMRRTGGSSDVS